MSENDRWTIPPAVHTTRVVLACRDLGEFQQNFLPRYRKEGIFVATRYTLRVGDRIRVKVELLDNSIGYAGEAVVAALDQEGCCPGIRVLLNPPPSDAQVTEPSVMAQPEIETIQVSMADLEIEPETVPVASAPPVAPVFRPGDAQIGMRLPRLAERLEVLAASALRVGDLEAAEANCRRAIQVDPQRASLRTLLRGIEARRRAGVGVQCANF